MAKGARFTEAIAILGSKLVPVRLATEASEFYPSRRALA